MATENEYQRYERQILIDGFGVEGQNRLKKAKVVIAGAGGLGGIIASYLTAAGVGHIRLIDHDLVELSNLNRQILYGDQDIGKRKADSARLKLQSLNKDVIIEAFCKTITRENASGLFGACELIVDALDNFPVRFILNEVAIQKRIPLFHGAVRGFEGRATTLIPGKTPCLKCLYPRVPDPVMTPVIGVTPALIGSIQATEVIKYITGTGELLANRLLIYDGMNLEFMEIKLKRRQDCEVCQHLHKDKA
jgi:molybdopterin/thiamine biosynthesis adenylyltransferase